MNHDSDCSTNNRGCPELLGECDCICSVQKVRATEKLRIRLKLKFLSKEIEKRVDWNFGYCPRNDKYFDSLIESRNSLLDIAYVKYRDIYDIYAYT